MGLQSAVLKQHKSYRQLSNVFWEYAQISEGFRKPLVAPMQLLDSLYTIQQEDLEKLLKILVHFARDKVILTEYKIN
jgi:hypothetical protein